MRNLLSKSLAEFLGVFAIVFFGCGSIMVSEEFNDSNLIQFIPLIFGSTVAMMIYALGHISGAHFNPAVTISFASVGRFSWREVPIYIIFQILGGIFASICLWILFPDSLNFGATVPAVSTGKSLLTEAILTFFLVFVIQAVSTDARAEGTMAGMAIGFTVMVGAFFGGSLTGASMNPARTIGPNLFQGDFASLWIYIVAPIVGGVLASFAYRFIRCEKNEKPSEVKGCC